MSNALATVRDKRASVDLRVSSLRDVMLKQKAKLAQGIGGLLTAERVIQVACNSIRKNPALLDCTPASLFAAIAEAATYGWVCDGIMGQASLVPFNNAKRNCKEVTLIPGYKGLRDLVRRSGECDVTMDSVHAGDTYEYRGRFELPKHAYGAAGDRRFQPVTHAYVVGHFRSQRVACFSWTAGECLAHRDRYSQNWKRNPSEDNPWHEKNPSFRVMCMKTVLLDAIHRGEFPMSVDAQRLVERVDEIKREAGGDVEDVTEFLLADAESVADATDTTTIESAPVNATVISEEPPTDERGDQTPVEAFRQRFAEAASTDQADAVLGDALSEELSEDATKLVREWHAEAIKRLTPRENPLDAIRQRMETATDKREVEAAYQAGARLQGVSNDDTKLLYRWRAEHMQRIHASRGERSNKQRTLAEP